VDISALLRKALPQSTLRIPQLKRDAPLAPPTSNQSATVVHFSKEASAVATDAGKDSGSELRALLGQYDFHNISARQMAQVGGVLFERKEISAHAAASFIGVETNLAEPLDPDKPIDMVQHFQRMSDAAAGANVREPGYFDFAVKYRQEATKALTDVMSFATDNRTHISMTR
jgi:hypothetical protein